MTYDDILPPSPDRHEDEPPPHPAPDTRVTRKDGPQPPQVVVYEEYKVRTS